MTKQKSFIVYISRTLRQVSPDLHITKVARDAVDSIVRVTATKLVDRALTLTSGSDKITVSASELAGAVKLVLPADLANEASTSGTMAVTKFSESVSEEKNDNNGTKKACTRESRAGLIFSVSAAEKYLRRFGQNGYHVAANAPVYLAAVLEQLTSDLLELSGSQTREAKKVTITIRHLFLGVASEVTLRDYVTSLGVVFLEAGVESHIEDKLLEKKPRKRLSTNGDGSRRPHRWRPGTKTLMEIRRLQKTGGVLMQHAPFNRLVRKIGEKFHPELRYSADFLVCLQAFVEDRMVNMMKKANLVAIQCDRETVYLRDVKLARDLSEPTLKYSGNDLRSEIPEAPLKRMSLRAGIKRYGDDSTQAYCDLLVDFLTSYLYDIIVCAEHHRVQTLNTKLMLEALSMRGLFPSITAHKRRVRKKGNDTTRSQTESVASDGEVSDVEETEQLATIAE